ncbi:protein kinase [Nocardia jiangxiensis]|uniref:Serine/threonine-protein kinase PknK n=1 Tax=Nocardia jiangxiensis TaxID=282685 RepID=A0ABW6S8N7_9NOCA
MADEDPLATHRDQLAAVDKELEAAGFGEIRVIGRGGFGVVYRCREFALDRTVAVKVLTSISEYGGENLDRFLREQRAMAKLPSHPNIVQIHQVGSTADGRPYLVMPYHSRGSLQNLIRREGPLPLPDVLRIAVKLAGALETVHRAGILHRDIKPGNVLITEYGEPQLTDFGIARIEGGFQTTTGVVTGSPAFTAPEVLRKGTPSVASDIYGLGATLFCMLTGHAAYERRTGEKLVAQFLRVTDEPLPNLRPEGIPDDVCDLIEQSMAADPRTRPQPATTFGEQVRRIQHSHGLHVDEMILPTGQPSPVAGGPALTEITGPEQFAASVSTGAPTPPTPATKFRPAISPRPLVRRERLLDQLNADPWPRLILIHAPAGFGKSTLAAQWGQQLVSDRVAACWLGIDTDDNNSTLFLLHLLEAIRHTRPAVEGELSRIIEEHGTNVERYVLTSLINAIHEHGERIVVIIEDWHRITSDATVAALHFLLEHGCHHLQILVTSRERSGLPLSAMRVSNELIEIDSAALRFDQTEAGELLVELGGIDIDDSGVSRLRENTDGWVAGLQLASISMRGHIDPSELIEHVSGRHHVISEYLADNVLRTLDPTLLQRLLETSVAEQICGSLATALTGEQHGQALLEEIEQRDLFLRRTDPDGHWFRYHHLFAEFLRQRLDRDCGERVGDLHRRAADWFARHHMLSEAIDHATAAQLPEQAVELVEEHAQDLVQHSQLATLTALAAKLPAAHAATHPSLQMALAWAAVLMRRADQLRTALDRVADAERAETEPGRPMSALMLEATLLHSVESAFADHTDDLDAAAEQCRSRPEELSAWVLCAAANVGAFSALHRFDFDRVRSWHEWGRPYFQDIAGALGPMYSHCLAGMAAREKLEMDRAEHHFRTAVHLARTATGEHSFTARLAGAVLGDFLYERDELDEADQLLEDAELGFEGGLVDLLEATYGTGARIKAALGDLPAAQRRLSEGERLARALTLPRLSARIESERVQLGLEHAPAPQLATPGPAADDGIAVRIRELREGTAIRTLLRDRPDLAAVRAAELTRSIDATRRPRATVYATLLQAKCLAEQHLTAEAKDLIASILPQCAKARLIRPILDEGPALARLAQELRPEAEPPHWKSTPSQVPLAFFDHLAAFSAPPGDPRQS